MAFADIYRVGKAIPLGWHDSSLEKKLRFVLFPYGSRDVISTTVVLFIGIALLAAVAMPLLQFAAYVLFFLAIVSAITIYIYPGHIFYGQAVGEYNEEMLRAILRMTTYVSMDTSIEHAVVQTTDHLNGTLRLQFERITNNLQRKQKTTLGDALEEFLPVWNEVNPTFVKSFRLLQTAALSKQEGRDAILEETVETMLLNYSTLGKRYAEELSNNAKKLITIGVLIPIMSLMIVPLLSIFMPELARPSILAFVYNAFFPTLTLLMALNFAAKRIQIDTIRIQDAAEYRPMPSWLMWACVGLTIVLAVPTLWFVTSVETGAADAESLYGVFLGWLISFGLAASCYIYALLYSRKYKKLWQSVYEVEQDLPHLLQSFTTYLTLNISAENVITEVIEDYEKFGFSDHPVVQAFKKIEHKLSTSKESLMGLVRNQLPKLLPSKKVNQILGQILSFGEISQQSAARISRMVRSQTISLYKLDDYMKTMLAETVGLVNITTTLLAPLLAASAVIMSVAIVKSLVFITEQLELIARAFGTANIGFTLVDTSQVVPPVFIEVIVGVYLIQTIIVLSFFATQVNVGNDKFKFWEALRGNMVGFVIYSVLLFGGYFFIVEVMFKSILGT